MFLCGNFALKPLQIGEIISNDKIMQVSHFYCNTNEKKADEKTTLIHDGICHAAMLGDASGEMHHGILLIVVCSRPSTEKDGGASRSLTTG